MGGGRARIPTKGYGEGHHPAGCAGHLYPSAPATDGRSVWVASVVENTLTRLTTG